MAISINTHDTVATIPAVKIATITQSRPVILQEILDTTLPSRIKSTAGFNNDVQREVSISTCRGSREK